MHTTTLDLMRDQVRAIYRALTGVDLPTAEGKPSSSENPVAAEVVARRFADLEAMARAIPSVMERVPPFSFAPPMDVIDDERGLLVELAVSGIEKDDVKVELSGEQLIVSGLRAGERVGNGRTCYHAEIPRGPFHRALVLPFPVGGEPRVEVERGLIRVHLAKARKAQPAKA